MSVLDDVFGSLRLMSLLQLLLAFVACTAYALAQGGLFGTRSRRIAWVITVLSAAGFAFVSADWVYATMLAGFAVAGVGVFVACTWLLSRALGFAKPRAVAEAVEFAASVDMESEFPPSHSQPALAPRTLPQHSGPAHSI